LLKELPGPRMGEKEDTIYNVRALFLKSMPFWIQIYIPLVYIIEFLFSQRSDKKMRHYWFISRNLNLAWRALACHKSQFVWYRMLSILFSRYTYINVLVEE
jgi:N-acetylglucosaminylphosphatidylinositol deacetylase